MNADPNRPNGQEWAEWDPDPPTEQPLEPTTATEETAAVGRNDEIYLAIVAVIAVLLILSELWSARAARLARAGRNSQNSRSRERRSTTNSGQLGQQHPENEDTLRHQHTLQPQYVEEKDSTVFHSWLQNKSPEYNDSKTYKQTDFKYSQQSQSQLRWQPRVREYQFGIGFINPSNSNSTNQQRYQGHKRSHGHISSPTGYGTTGMDHPFQFQNVLQRPHPMTREDLIRSSRLRRLGKDASDLRSGSGSGTGTASNRYWAP